MALPRLQHQDDGAVQDCHLTPSAHDSLYRSVAWNHPAGDLPNSSPWLALKSETLILAVKSLPPQQLGPSTGNRSIPYFPFPSNFLPITWIAAHRFYCLNAFDGRIASTMTTFTQLSDQDAPSLAIHPTRRISKINPNIYAGFTE